MQQSLQAGAGRTADLPVKSSDGAVATEHDAECAVVTARPNPKGAIRHLAVLSLLAEAESALTLNEIAVASGAPRPSVHRILGSLVQHGWVTVSGSPRRYAPSWRAVELGYQVARRSRVRDVLMEAATDLAALVRSRTYITFYEAGDVVFTDSIDVRGERLIPLLMGIRLPAAINVCGRVLLAYQSPAEINRALRRELPQLTERTMTSPEAVRARLEVIRERGYEVMDREGSPGVSGVGVPVFDSSLEVAASLGILIPGPLREEAVTPLLDPAFRIAQQASADLGAQL